MSDLSLTAISIAGLQKSTTDILMKVVLDNVSRIIRVPPETQISLVKSLIVSKLLIPDLKSEQLTLYLPFTGIFLQVNRPICSFYISKTDHVSLKKFEHPLRTVTVNIISLHKLEEVPVWKETTIMGLIQLLVNKDITQVTECFLSIDGKTALPMNDLLPKGVSHFSYCRYPVKFTKELGSSYEDKENLLFDSSLQSSRSPDCVRSSSRILISSNSSLVLNNLENQHPILIEKKWRTVAQDSKFIPLNRLFLPPLESVVSVNLPPNVNIHPIGNQTESLSISNSKEIHLSKLDNTSFGN
jgi:hypothetical protein